ncbi:MAG: cupin domain-containing protein [Nanoarchaeota archaeon]|nr:cupin domain-containing protein [Nanoarchaeota archaeon]
MKPFKANIEKEVLKNNYFRKVLFTGKHEQLVAMCLKPKEEIGNEIHKKVDQFFRIEQGEAKFVLFNGKKTYTAKTDDAVIIPAGTFHNIINNSKTKKLKLYTIYSPPNHKPKTIHKTKADAELAEH